MMDKTPKAFAIGDAAFRRCAHAGEFIATTVIPAILPHVESGTAGEILFAQLVRIDYWLRSLDKLASPTDYQAATAGCRSMLELAIDIALVRANPADFQTVLDWELSAKLHHAQALSTYCEKDKEIAPRFPRQINWVETERDGINALRLQHRWVKKLDDGTEKPKHPQRWTNRDLASDAREADKVQENWRAEGPTFRFERYYETRYRELCWDTHGSGNVHRGQVGGEHLSTIGAYAFFDSGRMAMTAAYWVVLYFDLWNADMEKEFDGAAGMMHGLYVATLKAHGIEVPADEDESDSEEGEQERPDVEEGSRDQRVVAQTAVGGDRSCNAEAASLVEQRARRCHRHRTARRGAWHRGSVLRPRRCHREGRAAESRAGAARPPGLIFGR
jgi:hypothetical protein